MATEPKLPRSARTTSSANSTKHMSVLFSAVLCACIPLAWLVASDGSGSASRPPSSEVSTTTITVPSQAAPSFSSTTVDRWIFSGTLSGGASGSIVPQQIPPSSIHVDTSNGTPKDASFTFALPANGGNVALVVSDAGGSSAPSITLPSSSNSKAHTSYKGSTSFVVSRSNITGRFAWNMGMSKDVLSWKLQSKLPFGPTKKHRATTPPITTTTTSTTTTTTTIASSPTGPTTTTTTSSAPTTTTTTSPTTTTTVPVAHVVTTSFTLTLAGGSASSSFATAAGNVDVTGLSTSSIRLSLTCVGASTVSSRGSGSISVSATAKSGSCSVTASGGTSGVAIVTVQATHNS